MCEFTAKKIIKKASNYFTGKNMSDLRHPLLMERFPHAFKPAHCPVCGKYLSNSERRPAGMATRSMCAECYERLVAKGISYDCFMCGNPLPNSKIRVQGENIREISEHIHDEHCINYWTVIHNVAVSEPGRESIFTELPEHTQSNMPFESHFNKPQIQYQIPGYTQKSIPNGDFSMAAGMQNKIIEKVLAETHKKNTAQLPHTKTYKGKPIRTL